MSFQCKLDKGAFRPCRSPFTKRVKPGAHTFEVRALSSAGLTDLRCWGFPLWRAILGRRSTVGLRLVSGGLLTRC